MLINIGADYEIELAQRAEIFRINVKLLEGMVAERLDEKILLVGESDGTAFLQQFLSEDSVAASEIDSGNRGVQWNGLFLKPIDRIARLQAVEFRVVPVFKMMRNEFGQDHGLIVARVADD